ncbi:MAG: hypothetical protein DMF63_02500 [Acidobacteria bacterium]|nr:MAG: hypothetical protein DMF63_02500 [Acidobacteriota bacterium]
MELQENLRNARSELPIIDSVNSGLFTRVAVVIAIALSAFLLGFSAMWITSNGYEYERDSLRKSLRRSVLQNSLATAALEAQKGEFEQARQQSSSFFTDLRADIEGNDSSYPPEQQERIGSILVHRDETITLLSRADAMAPEQLSNLYFNFMKVQNSAKPTEK